MAVYKPLFTRIAKTREEYINRFKGHHLAIKVKLNDLRHNMDITRLPNPTEKDYVRLERYEKEYEALMEMFKEAYAIQYPTLVEDAGRLSE